MIAPNFDNIPAELRQIPRWVCWRFEHWDGPDAKPRKVPYDPRSLKAFADSTDPSTWASFEEARTAYCEREGERDAYSGVGFVVNGDGLNGIDLDGCVQAGVPIEQATALLDGLGATYRELSPSGEGVRAFGFGEVLDKGKVGVKDGVNVELYSSNRFLTITGCTLKDGPIGPLKGFKALADSIHADKKVNPETGEIEDRPPDERHAELVRRVLSGDVYHDSLRDLAASLIATGMHPGAVVNHLRGLMDNSAGPHDDRWRARLNEIRGLVTSAQAKYGQPATQDQASVVPLSAFMGEGAKLDYIVQHLFVRGYLYALVAQYGTGKTAVCLHMAAMLARGEALMGRKSVRCKVLYLCGENPDDVRLRFEVMLLDMGIDPASLADWIYFTQRPFALDDEAQRNAFVQSALKHGPYDAMFIDTGPAHAAVDDENDNRAMHTLAMAIRDAMAPIGMPMTIVLMHPVKGATKDNLLPRGGSAFTGSIDGVVCLWRDRKGDPVELFAHGNKFRGQHFAGEFFELKHTTHPTKVDNFGDAIHTVIALPSAKPSNDPGADLQLLTPSIRAGILRFMQAVEGDGDWLGNSTSGPASNNLFKKSWHTHWAYPTVLLGADDVLKRHTFGVIEQMKADGLIVAERRPSRPEQRQRDWPMGVWLTDKGRAELKDSGGKGGGADD